MALIDPTDTATQQTLFIAGLTQQEAGKAKDLETYFNGLMDAVWSDGKVEVQLPNGQRIKVVTGLTVEQKIAAMGNKAGVRFAVAAKLREVLVLADPTAADRLRPTPPEYAKRLEFHADGTVTVKDVVQVNIPSA